MHLALINALQYFRTTGHDLVVGGISIAELAKQYATPFYVYDLAVARQKFKRLRAALPGAIAIHYAVKANPHPKIISFFKSQGTGFDVASKRELQTTLELGVQPDVCGFAGPGKSEKEISYAIQEGIGALHIESPRELFLANEIAGQLHKKVNIALRLNPPFALKRSGVQMNGGASAFGIDIEQIPTLLAQMPFLSNLVFKGFHLFAGSQNLDAEAVAHFFVRAFSLLRELSVLAPEPVTWINLGGGFGIPYFQSDQELDIAAIGKTLAKLLEANRDLFAPVRFILESGRYLIGECGLYVTRVRYRKESRGKTFLVVEGGLNHHLAATGNFGQVVRKNYPVAVLQKINASPVGKFNIVGPLCTPLDVLGWEVELPEVVEGDLIGVFASGAYGYTASPHNFLSHPEPIEIILNE